MVDRNNIEIYLANVDAQNKNNGNDMLLTDMASVIELYVCGLVGMFHSFAKQYKGYSKTPLYFLTIL